MNKLYIIILVAIVFVGCKEPFDSPVSTLTKDVLCIEGFINTGDETSTFTLTKLQDLKDVSAPIPELKAQVLIEEENGASVLLKDEGKGVYSIAPRSYNASKRYRLSITRSSGKKYVSDFVNVTTAPPIDKLGYRVDSTGVTILLDTHNAINAPRYYYWNYEETWYFSVPTPSRYYFDVKSYKFLKRDEDLEYCYRTEKSNKLVIGTSIKYTDNVIKDQEITFADAATKRLKYIYSINVAQHAIDKDYFEYLQKLKKNTETIGSIFDEQPTQNTGNIHALANAEEVVVGFFTIHSVVQKRIFIKANELPTFPYIALPDCETYAYDFWYIDRQNNMIYLYPEEYFLDPTKLLPVNYRPNVSVTGASPACADCRLRGVLAKPSFWPY